MLSWSHLKGTKGIIPLNSIISVRLYYSPTRIEKIIYVIEIIDSQGVKTNIKNISYKGVANFEDQSEAYNKFVTELNSKIYEANPKTKFISGVSSGLYGFYWLLIIFSTLIMVASFVYILTVGMIWIVFAHLLVLVYLFSITKKFMKRNKPGEYDPKNIPQNLLPNY